MKIPHFLYGLAALALLLLWPVPARAYIDPGAGSFFIQILFGMALSAVAFVKLFWYRLKKLLSKKSPDRPSKE